MPCLGFRDRVCWCGASMRIAPPGTEVLDTKLYALPPWIVSRRSLEPASLVSHLRLYLAKYLQLCLTCYLHKSNQDLYILGCHRQLLDVPIMEIVVISAIHINNTDGALSTIKQSNFVVSVETPKLEILMTRARYGRYEHLPLITKENILWWPRIAVSREETVRVGLVVELLLPRSHFAFAASGPSQWGRIHHWLF